MSVSLTTLLISTAGIGSLVVLGVRDHRRLRASRHGLLEQCTGIIDGAVTSHAGDGFPRLEGYRRGRPVRVDLIPDTMTIRRLPQLWLSVTLMSPLPVRSGFAILVRPSGNDFYSLTESLRDQLDPPPGLPWEILIRGADHRAKPLLDRLGSTLGSILSDPRVKEVAVTDKGVRLVRQAAEGRRGEHLLLRQAIFDDAVVSGADLAGILVMLDALAAEVSGSRPRDAAGAEASGGRAA